jgi:hypothetical protein
MEMHESFARVERDYIEEKLGKVERELHSIVTLFQTYVSSGEDVFLEWAWENIAFLADRENSIGREWDYIADRHDENRNKTRVADSGEKIMEVQ